MKRKRLQGKQSVVTCDPDQTWCLYINAITHGLTIAAYTRLKAMGAPIILMQLMHIVVQCSWGLDSANTRGSLSFLELFCGVASITRAFENAGFVAAGYDYLKDPYYDFAYISIYLT